MNGCPPEWHGVEIEVGATGAVTCARCGEAVEQPEDAVVIVAGCGCGPCVERRMAKGEWRREDGAC